MKRSDRNATAIKAALALLAIALSVWVVVRTFAGDERAVVRAQAEEQARQEALREQFPTGAGASVVIPSGRTPN